MQNSSYRSDVAGIGLMFLLGGVIALIWGGILCLKVMTASPNSVEEQLSNLDIEGSSRISLLTALGAWQHVVAGIAALVTAQGLNNEKSWGRRLGLHTAGWYSAWMAWSVYSWWFVNDPYVGRDFDTLVALVAVGAALITGFLLYGHRELDQPASLDPRQFSTETRFFSGAICSNSDCGLPLESGWSFCPYCDVGRPIPRSLSKNPAVERACPNAACGRLILDDTRACPACGQFLIDRHAQLQH